MNRQIYIYIYVYLFKGDIHIDFDNNNAAVTTGVMKYAGLGKRTEDEGRWWVPLAMHSGAS